VVSHPATEAIVNEALPRVLLVTTDSSDYLADTLVHGLRLLLGEGLVETPRRDPLYTDFPSEWRGRQYGRGFTLYSGSLDPIPIDRSGTRERLAAGEFDLLVIGDIWRCYGTFVDLLPLAGDTPIAVLDGVDSEAPVPYEPRWWRRPSGWFLPRPHRRAVYFKRELTPRTRWFRSYLTNPVARRPPRSMRPISFGIPEHLVLDELPPKRKDFPAHVVDPEVAHRVGAATSYAFADEGAYYEDLRASRFGITTRRGGWDCMRHYEIAASGCVVCFRGLSSKPDSCAPHGLDGSNALDYDDADGLLGRIEALSAAEERELQHAALSWARQNTTREVARRFLGTLGYRLS
jgi:hypothetical protein